MLCEDGGRDWRDVFTNQGAQGLPATPKAKRKAWNRSSLDPSEGVLLSSLEVQTVTEDISDI